MQLGCWGCMLLAPPVGLWFPTPVKVLTYLETLTLKPFSSFFLNYWSLICHFHLVLSFKTFSCNIENQKNPELRSDSFHVPHGKRFHFLAWLNPGRQTYCMNPNKLMQCVGTYTWSHLPSPDLSNSFTVHFFQDLIL